MRFLELTRTHKRVLMLYNIEEIVYPRIKILSSFIHPHVIPNLYGFLSFAEHKTRYFGLFLSIQ